MDFKHAKVSFFGQCSKMQIIPIKIFIIETCFIQFLWVFRLKCWFKGQIISRIHLSLPNAYKLMCFDRNINGNRDDKFFDWDYWSLHLPKKLTLDKLLESTLSKYVWYTNIFSNIWKSFWRTYIQLNDEIFFCLFLQKALFMTSFNTTLMKNCWLMGAVRWDYIIPRSTLKKKL